jgi:hypothetical protein
VTHVEPHPDASRIDDYLRGRLSEEATRQFELRLLEDEALFAAVQREALLLEGMRDAPEVMETPSVALPDSGADRSIGAWLRWLHPPLTAALALGSVVLVFANLGLRQQVTELSAPRSGVPVVTLQDQRALFTEEPTLRAPLLPADGPILLEIDVSAHAEEEFRVEIRTARDRYLHERVRRDARGYVTVYLPAGFQSVVLVDAEGKVFRRFDGNTDHRSGE